MNDSYMMTTETNVSGAQGNVQTEQMHIYFLTKQTQYSEFSHKQIQKTTRKL